MITIPFERRTFSAEMKPLISGNNLTLEFDNVQSTLAKVAVELQKYLGKDLYEHICDGTAATGETDQYLNATSKDYLKRAMLHFAMYHHIIYLIANIGNDGITVKKTDEATTIYKYQQDELQEHLVGDAWFWLNELVKLLNDNATHFPDWTESEERKAVSTLPVSIADFERYVGVSDAVFMMYAQWIIMEVYVECILSRIDVNTAMTDKMKRALCYEVLGRCCQRLAYHCLPAPIRLDINNEMGKNHAADADKMIRERVADIYIGKAKSYWVSVDAEVAEIAATGIMANVSKHEYRRPKESEDQRFAAI